MRLITKITISLYLFTLIYSECAPETEITKVRNANVCKERVFSEEENEDMAFKCCYMIRKIDNIVYNGNENGCVALTQYEYTNIKNTLLTYKDNDVKEVKIDCKSLFLSFYFLGLFLLLF